MQTFDIPFFCTTKNLSIFRKTLKMFPKGFDSQERLPLAPSYYIDELLLIVYSARKMDFKMEEPWSAEKYFRSRWLGHKRSFRILDALEWLKQ